MNADLQSLAQSLVARVLNSIPDAIGLTCMVWGYSRLLRPRSSAARFIAWLIALLGVVLLPIFAGLHFGASASLMATTKLHPKLVLPVRWAEYLLAAWAIGAILLLARLAVGLRQLCGSRSRCTALDPATLNPSVAEVVRKFDLHQVEICSSAELVTAAVVGFFRPAIVFPASLLPQLSAAEVELILLHEFAHLRRRDQWSNLAQKIVKALFFFHPAVCWIEYHLTLEREMACDDLVVQQSASPKTYASCLIAVAEKLQNKHDVPLLEALVSRMRQLSLRVAQILDAPRQQSSTDWKPAVSVGAALVALIFASAPGIPRFISFQAEPLPNPSQITAAQTTETNAGQIVAVRAHRTASRATSEGALNAVTPAHIRRDATGPTAIATDYPLRPASEAPHLASTMHARHAVALPAKAAQKQRSYEVIVILETSEPSADPGVAIRYGWSADGTAAEAIVFAI